MTRRWALVLVGAAALSSMVGCGEGGGAATAKVTGTVTINGAPANGVSVSFTGGNRPAVGTTDAAGKFKLSCFKKEDGAMPGSYTVVFSGEGVPANADQKATVEAGKVNDFKFDLKKE